MIGNALKFTFSGSITVNIFLVGKMLYTEVVDTGIGIKEEDIDNLFKFFGKISSTSKLNQSGMGFGLTIAKMIVQHLNGEITLASTF